MKVSTKSVWRTVGAAALALGVSSQAQAATIYSTGGSSVSIPGLTTAQTSGDEMAGITVTAFFNGDIVGTSAVWAVTGAGAGGATFGSNWSLSQSGDTYDHLWTFTNNGKGLLTGLRIDGSTGLTVFDRSSGEYEGTPGSARGFDFTTAAGGAGDILVTYLSPVALSPNAAVEDLFQMVQIDFSGLDTDGIGASFTFRQDTDNDSRLTVPAPEPATLALFGVGLIGLARARRRARD